MLSDKKREELEVLKRYIKTERQREVVGACLKHGSHIAAAKALGVAKTTVNDVVYRLREKAKKSGYSPEDKVSIPPLPEYSYKRISTFYNSDGSISKQWLIQEPDKVRQITAMMDTMDRLSEGLPRIPEIGSPSIQEGFEDLVNQYTITDYHFGMLAWHKEGGADWNLEIAKETLIDSFKFMIEKAPNAKTGIFCNIGDFLHYDGWMPVTPGHGHVLDADSRFPKIIDVVVDTVIDIIGMLLQKHEEVIVVNMQGNHDLGSSYWLQKICEKVFEKNSERLIIPQSRIAQVDRIYLPYYALQFGNTSLFYHHGHKRKIKEQGRKYPALFPKIWGNTTKRYGHTGHLHHSEVHEDDGVKVEMHNTLAASDAYSSHGAYISERCATVITYHNEYGEIARANAKPEMLVKYGREE